MQRRIETIDAVLSAHSAELGADFAAYRNHVYRVANLCFALNPSSRDDMEKVALAAAFHDLGIWTDRTFDYLGPSVALACTHLRGSGRENWSDEIAAMILEHHKITRYRAEPDWLVESFRRADWIDISRGLLRFGLSPDFLREILSVWPDAGFHARLARLALRRLKAHPLGPLPMIRF